MQADHAGRYRVIHVTSNNWWFRRTKWLSAQSGVTMAGVVIALAVTAAFVVGSAVSPASFKTDGAGMTWVIAGMVLTILLLCILTVLSRASRTIGQNGIGLGAISRGLKTHNVRTPWFSYVRPIGIAVVALLAGAIVFSRYALMHSFPAVTSAMEAAELWLVPIVFAFLAFVLRHFLRPAAEVMERSGQAPVVFLRSFGDDGIDGRQLHPFHKASFEEAVGRSVRRFGPFVAIGRPSEDLPLLGAARDYVSNDAWQAHALDLMQKAKLIIVAAGTSEGLKWEFQRIIEGGWHRKLLIVMPPVPNAERANRTAMLSRSLSGTPWSGNLADVDGSDVMALRLDDNGNVVAVAAAGEGAYHQFFAEVMWVGVYGLLCRELPQP